MKYFISIVILLVVLTAGIGLYFAGSPKQERLRRLDEMRVEHLANIQNQIVEHWRVKKSLPASLSDVRDAFGAVSLPTDPDTGAAYEYGTTGADSFFLCAQFAASSTEQFGYPAPTYPRMYGEGGVKGGDVWPHAAGRVCFTRTIDKDFFAPPPLRKD